MIKTLDILKAQKQNLFEKNPDLKKANVLEHDYKGETRMRFTPEFVEKNANNLSGTVILHDGNIVASVLTFPNLWLPGFNQIKSNQIKSNQIK